MDGACVGGEYGYILLHSYEKSILGIVCGSFGWLFYGP